MRPTLPLIALMLMLSVSAFAQVNPVPQIMQFQARLTRPDGTSLPDGTYSIRFSLWNVASGGTAAANEKWNQTINVTVRNGNFSTLLNTSTGDPNKFNSDLFLEIKIGTDAPLTPRQPMASVAYAMKANSVRDGSITSASIANGTITVADLAPNTLNNLSWLLSGNANPSASSFLGTTTNHPLNLKVNNHRAVQYTYMEDTSSSDPTFHHRTINVLGGADINSIAPGVRGATIVGGGDDYFTGTDYPNMVTDNFGTVVGGSLNRADGFSFVGGGYNNKATEFYSTIVGGTYNTASHNQTFIGGGILNTASGFGATVPGGQGNTAAGTTSFAAGNNAQALHDGSFVWADNQSGAFASTGANQFMVRAGGGIFLLSGFVGIGTNAPQGALHIKGFQGALNLEGTTQHVYMQFFPRGLAAGRKAYFGFPSAGSHDLEIANEDTGVLRVRGTFVNSSDARYKTNVATLDNALENILNLRGVSYDWRKDRSDLHATEQRQIGFIAQEVEKVLPELVYTDNEGYKSVAYLNVVPVLVEAIKTQQKQMDAKEKRLAALETDNTTLKAANAELKERLEALATAVAELKANNK